MRFIVFVLLLNLCALTSYAQNSADESFQEAFEYMQAQELEKAKSSFHDFIEDFPKDSLAGSAYYWLGEIYKSNNNYSAAISMLARGIRDHKTSSKLSDMHVVLAEILQEQGNKEYACYTINSIEKPSETFIIASMLKDLRNEQSSIVDEEKDKKVALLLELKCQNEQPLTDELISNLITPLEKTFEKLEVSSGIQIDQLTLEELDYLIQKLASCWSAPAGAVIKKGMMVKIAANYDEQGRVDEDSIRLLDTNIDSSNEFYSILVESAIRTFSQPECKTLNLPKEKYELWKQVNVTFDHSIMKGYE